VGRFRLFGLSGTGAPVGNGWVFDFGSAGSGGPLSKIPFESSEGVLDCIWREQAAVWLVIEQDLPALAAAVDRMIARAGSPR
jgi:hypothetical protein